jgi:hypothetical protein
MTCIWEGQNIRYNVKIIDIKPMLNSVKQDE